MSFPALFIEPCSLCGVATTNTLPLCPGCRADLPGIESSCTCCGLPLPADAEQLHCGECQSGGSPFTLAVTPLYYQQPLSQLVTAFKHRRGLAQGQLLAHLLSDEIRDTYIERELPDVILPVPLHWQRWLWRGYNQSAELGKQLSGQLGIACETGLLKRLRRTPSQQGLSRPQRLRNLKDAFCLKKPLAFRRVALLDDVVTTGSTASEIARLLRVHGAEEVHLWAVARTPLSSAPERAVEMSGR